jgi:hypothetical protein
MAGLWGVGSSPAKQRRLVVVDVVVVAGSWLVSRRKLVRLVLGDVVEGLLPGFVGVVMLAEVGWVVRTMLQLKLESGLELGLACP